MNALIPGDCMDMLPLLNAESVDAIVTDPPYDLTAGKKGGNGAASVNLNSPAGRSRIGTGGGFMGKQWDATGIAFDPATWAECLRVLKPGGYLLAFGGARTWHRMVCAIEDAGYELRDSIAWLYGSGFPKSLDVGKAIDKAGGEGVWSGWGTALKPAFEPICVARKPLSGTVAANVLAHGTGALNIDACRIPTDDKLGGGQTSGAVKFTHDGRNRPWMDDPEHVARVAADAARSVAKAESLGRWPANVVLDESQAAALDEQTGTLTSGSMAGAKRKAPGGNGVTHGAMGAIEGDGSYYADSGGASRFFYVAKAPAKERPKIEGAEGHPTVKPLTLLRWLVRLVTPPGGTVLDPFLGSGTTAEACLLEGFRCIGIEREQHYIELAKLRLSKHATGAA